jgi:hypothetical protein
VARSSDSAAIAAHRTDAFLNHVIQRHKERAGNIHLDAILFNTVMGLWAKSNRSKSYRKARSILDRQLCLVNVDPPDVFGFTSVLSSCAAESGRADERRKAFLVATSTYKLMQKQDLAAPNHVTYGTMIKCAAKLLPIGDPLRRKWVRMVFADAVKNGCVGDMVLSKVREAATPDLYKELLEGHSRIQLPTPWTCNVQEQSAYRTKGAGVQRRNTKRAEV